MTRLTFLGTGTSTGIPLIGCNCETCRSNDPKDNRLRASALIETDTESLLVDAGPDFRQQLLRNKVSHLEGILLTHDHYDHVGGLDDVRPLGNINVYAEQNVLSSIHRTMPYCFAGKPYPGVPRIELHTIGTDAFYIGNTRVIPLRAMHAKLPILGYRIGNLAYFTDAKTLPETTLQQLAGLEILVLNALRHEPHIAHITLDEAITMAGLIGARKTFFTHFSHDIGKHEIVSLILPENMYLAFDGLQVLID